MLYLVCAPVRARLFQVEKKEAAIAKCKKRAAEELLAALDAGGQVYVFGLGASNQMLGKQQPSSFHQYKMVQRVWNDRVNPLGTVEERWGRGADEDSDSDSDSEEEKITVVDPDRPATPLNSRNWSERAITPRTPRKGATINPFAELTVMGNTAGVYSSRKASLPLETALTL